MMTQFIRCYIDPVTHSVEHVYCNDIGRQPEHDIIGKEESPYLIVDATMWVEAYIPPSELLARVSYDHAQGTIALSELPKKARQPLNQVEAVREQVLVAREEAGGEGIASRG